MYCTRTTKAVGKNLLKHPNNSVKRLKHPIQFSFGLLMTDDHRFGRAPTVLVVRYRGRYKVIRKVLGKGIINSMHASETNEQPSRPKREV